MQIGQLGELPDNIRRLLESYDDKYNYYRKGVSTIGSPNSFLECCLQLFDKDFQESFGPGVETTRELINEFVIAKRTELANESNLESIRQENYEYSVEEIRANILDQSNYFDPNRYIKLLENLYKVNIVLFSRIDQQDGTYSIPHHSMNYLEWNRQYDKTIIIYEHTGPHDVDAEFPHCETIVMSEILKKEAIQDNLTYIVTSDMVLYDELTELEVTMNTSYNLGSRCAPFDEFPGISSKLIRVISQYIDNYGKTRIVNVQFDDTVFSIMTSPLPNLTVPEMSSDESYESISLTKAINFAKVVNGKIVGKVCYDESLLQRVRNSNCIELHIEIYSTSTPIRLILSVKDELVDMSKVGKKICDDKSIPSVVQEFVTTRETEQIDKFRYLANVAEWLTEYNYWLFSKYCYEKSIMLSTEFEQKDLDIGLLNRYVDEKFIYIDNYLYERPVQMFSLDSTMIRDGKLIISGMGSRESAKANADDIVQRLIYTLRIKQLSIPSVIFGMENYNSLQFYYKKLTISNYYQNVTDFTKYPHEIIFPSTLAIKLYKQQQSQSIQLFTQINTNLTYPYLLQSELTNNKIVLCHNTNNLTIAYNIGVVWEMQKFNPMEPFTKTIPLGPFTLISPSHMNDDDQFIQTERQQITSDMNGITHNDLNINVNIVAYLLEGTQQPQYTTLLFL